jgi:hypothetical protein
MIQRINRNLMTVTHQVVVEEAVAEAVVAF